MQPVIILTPFILHSNTQKQIKNVLSTFLGISVLLLICNTLFLNTVLPHGDKHSTFTIRPEPSETEQYGGSHSASLTETPCFNQ